MIFLLKDGSCRVQDPTPYNDAKTAKYHRKYADRLEAVLIESMTRLRSDCYVVVKGDRFRSHIKPFKMTYTISMSGPDMPISEDNSLTRTIDVDNVYDYYNSISLLYQFSKVRELCDALHFYDIIITLLRVTIRLKGGSFSWTMDSSESLDEFLRRQDMHLDTDEFLDARMSRAEMVANGDYRIEMVRDDDGSQHLSYYIHDRRYRLHIRGNRWDKVLLIPPDFPVMKDLEIYGTCINGTGLLYAATKPIAMRIEKLQSCEIDVLYGEYQHYDGITVAEVTHSVGEWEYSAYSELDILYLVLYLPQILDFQRALFSSSLPVKIDIELLSMRHYEQRACFDLPEPEEGSGIVMDLFGMLAATLLTDWKDITKYDL